MERVILEEKIVTSDLQKIFGVSLTTLAKWRNQGMPYFRVGKGASSCILYDPLEIKEWAESHNKSILDPKFLD